MLHEIGQIVGLLMLATIIFRNVRRDAQDALRDMENSKEIGEDDFHRSQDDLQKLTVAYTEKIEEVGQSKEEEILEV